MLVSCHRCVMLYTHLLNYALIIMISSPLQHGIIMIMIGLCMYNTELCIILSVTFVNTSNILVSRDILIQSIPCSCIILIDSEDDSNGRWSIVWLHLFLNSRHTKVTTFLLVGTLDDGVPYL